MTIMTKISNQISLYTNVTEVQKLESGLLGVKGRLQGGLRHKNDLLGPDAKCIEDADIRHHKTT